MKTNLKSSPNPSFILLLAAIMALGLVSVPSASAASGNWTNDAAGNWSTAANWNPNAVPGTAAGDVVGLTTNITAARTVTLDTAATVGTLNIGDPTTSFFGYTLSGGSTLTFDNGGSSANLVQATVGGAADSISTPVTLSDNLTVFNINGLTLSGNIGDAGGGKSFTKSGTGTLTLTGTDGYTGNTVVNAGTLDIGGSTANGSVSSSSVLSLGGGTLSYTRTGGNAQNFNGVSLTGGSSAIKNTLSTSGHTMALGAITQADTAATVDFTTTGIITTTTTTNNGVLGGWATIGNNVTSGTVGDWATTNGSGQIVAYASYTSGTPSGVTNNGNYKTAAAATVSANATVSSLIISGLGGATTIGNGVTLTLTSGGLFIGGTQRFLVAGNSTSTIKSGLPTGELYLHCNNSSYTDSQIQPVIADGAVATKVIKDGPGVLKLRGYTGSGTADGYNKTYTGGTVVNGGTLQLSFNATGNGGGTGVIRGTVTINPGATLTTGTVQDSLGFNAGVSVTNININGGTLDNNGAGNQSYRAVFNLTGGTASASGGGAYHFDPTTGAAINSLASPIVSTISAPVTLRGNGMIITTALGTVPSGIDLNISGAIGESGGSYNLAKAGAGRLRLSNANTYSGSTIVSAGTLDVTGSLLSSSSFTVSNSSTFKLDASNVFTAGHGTAMGSTRLITVDNATWLMGTNFSGRVGNITLQNGATWTCDRPVTGAGANSFDALLANTSGGAATVLVTNTSGTTAATLNGAGGVRLENVQNFDIADVTGSSASDFNVSLVLADKSIQAGSTNGGINKLGLGTMTLSAANTYSNYTVINAGTLALSGSGSISNSRGITLTSSSATFDVSGVTFTLGASQPLVGLGTVAGTVNVASTGTITATNSGGNLTFSGLTFNNFATNNVRPGVAYLVVTNSNGLTTSGAANSVRINLGAGALTAGTYTLIDYDGTIQGTGFSAFQLGTTPGGLFSYTLVDNTVGTSVDLQVTALTATWSGALSSEWSTNALSNPKNWLYSGSPANFTNGQDVVFDDTLTGTSTVDLSVADVTLASLTFNNVNSNYTLQGTAAIAGTVGLTKTGAGTVTINNTNKFTGAVSVTTGTIAAGNIANKGVDSALGAGTNITVASGILSYTGGTGSSDRPVSVNSSTSTLEVTAGGTTLTLGGVIGGTGGLTKSGNGTLVLTNLANSYASNNILAGTLSVSTNVQLGGGPVNFGGGTLDFTGSSALAFTRTFTLNAGGGTIQVDTAGGVSISSALGGIGGLTKSGTGNLTLSGISTFTGGTTVSAGTLTLANGGGTGAIRGTLNINPGATVNLTAADAIGYDTGGVSCTNINIVGGTLTASSGANQGYVSTFNLTGGTMAVANYNFNGSAGAINTFATNIVSTISGGVDLRAANKSFTITTASGTVSSNVDLNITGAFSSAFGGTTASGFTKAGTGTLQLSAVNEIPGGINLNAGTLILNQTNALGKGSGTGTLTIAGGNLDSAITNLVNAANNPQAWNSDFTFVGSQSLNLGTGAVTMSTNRQVTVSANTLTVGGAIGGGAFGVTKTGSGTLTFTGNNTYTGATVVSNGTFLVHGNNGSSAVTVASGATLGGNGRVSSVSVLDGGNIAPGASVGKLTVTNLTLAATSTNYFEFDVAGGTNDTIADFGTLTPGGSKVVVSIANGTLASGTYRLIDYTGTKSGTFDSTVVLASGTAAHGLRIRESVANQINLIVNTPPVAVADSYSRSTGVSIKITKSALAANDTDVDGDTPVFDTFSSTNGGVTSDATYIFLPGNTMEESFTYNVIDGFGGTNTGTVTIGISSNLFGQGTPAVTPTPSNTTATFFGIPGQDYYVQRDTNVDFAGAGLSNFPTAAAPGNGVITISDDFSDIGGAAGVGSAFYRLVVP